MTRVITIALPFDNHNGLTLGPSSPPAKELHGLAFMPFSNKVKTGLNRFLHSNC